MEYIKKFIEVIKSLLNRQEKKRIVENAIIVIIIGAIIIIAGGSLFKKDDGKDTKALPQEKTSVETANRSETNTDLSETEKRLGEFLSKIEGAGRVDVMITYVSGKEIVPALDIKRNDNDTQEKDSGGGTRNIKQNDYESKMVFEEGQNGVKKPVITKELQPEVKGVVVVADGAAEPQVRESLSRAVQVLTDVPIHKIQVLERKK